ncbi:MaoC family dehydratase N-terminal domain-containing protein [Actinocorallia sp. A-T 12471]|uniref:MaoC family dehydratase N-terminal domain-containing protein n=1 Tax=Actinocorallia sp. A-T 12471 TaxID=3089813 RepID=UPI0029D2BA3C|nr:MaoC family dehydratase N-terminal domain-containing protein [Actinocorallia sp. A-T 12471]MDX6740712.1 MaoC family dehydratase N-terminal domain-containing protein [Actinocorallia sp. A-T 12471]
MAVDRARALALDFPPLTVTAERGRLVFFARATGQTDPVYTDVSAARAAGHPDLPVPPTFLFGLEMERPEPFGWLAGLGVDLRHVLHGEQAFTYHALAYAGDELTLTTRITDVAVKKGGALELLTKETTVTRDGEPVAESVGVLVVRRPEAAR